MFNYNCVTKRNSSTLVIVLSDVLKGTNQRLHLVLLLKLLIWPEADYCSKIDAVTNHHLISGSSMCNVMLLLMYVVVTFKLYDSDDNGVLDNKVRIYLYLDP